MPPCTPAHAALERTAKETRSTSLLDTKPVQTASTDADTLTCLKPACLEALAYTWMICMGRR